MNDPVPTRHRTLHFEGGVSNTTIIEATDGDPHVRIALGTEAMSTAPDDDLVVVRRPDFSDRMLRRPPHRRIQLPVAGCWSIEVDGSAAQLTINLDVVGVAGIDIEGSASQLALCLATPNEPVAIDIAGAVSALTLDRPAPVAATVDVRGGVRDLHVDQQSIGSAAGPVTLGVLPNDAAPGYHVRITGSVSGVRIGTTPV